VQVEDKRLVTSNTHDKKTAERQQHEWAEKCLHTSPKTSTSWK
jgi:hypothetical protein